MSTLNRKLVEELEVLAGWRGTPQQQAMRRGDLANTQELIASLRVSAQSISRDLSNINSQLSSVGGDVDQLKDRATASEQKLSSIESRITSVGNQLGILESRIQNANDTLEETDFNLNQLSNQYQQLQSSYNDVIASVSSVTIPAIGASQISSDPTAANYNTLLNDVTNLHQAIVDLKAAITS